MNRGSRLPDGANMVITVGYYADRSGAAYPEQLEPDEHVPSLSRAWPFPTDRVSAAASTWLLGRPACR